MVRKRIFNPGLIRIEPERFKGSLIIVTFLIAVYMEKYIFLF